jgi:hypothetical protein
MFEWLDEKPGPNQCWAGMKENKESLRVFYFSKLNIQN